MALLTSLESSPASGATLDRHQAPFYTFADATVWSPPDPVIMIKALPSLTRPDGHLEISHTAGIPTAARDRLERVLARINVLLESPATDDLAAVDSRVVMRALEAISGVTAGVTVEAEVFPLADGGLAFRWRTADGVVDVEFDAEGDGVVLLDDAANGKRKTGYFADTWAEALRWLQLS
jgi:hypothetical protein